MERKENLSLSAMLGVLLGAYTYDVHIEGGEGSRNPPILRIFIAHKFRTKRGGLKKTFLKLY